MRITALILGTSILYPLAGFSRELAAAPTASVLLSCERDVVDRGKPFHCRLLLEVDDSVGTAFVPRTVTPFPIPTRPPAIVRFFAAQEGREVPLELTRGAVRGRYDLGALSPWEMQVIGGGEIIGWKFDLNGDNWELPALSGDVQLVAELEISYRTGGPLSEFAPQARKWLDSCFFPMNLAELEHLFLRGKWRSPPIKVRLDPKD
jgi:hypothetical protein